MPPQVLVDMGKTGTAQRLTRGLKVMRRISTSRAFLVLHPSKIHPIIYVVVDEPRENPTMGCLGRTSIFSDRES